ncbi:MAG: single-stranded-DNA-specific exonuclease RecJ [Deltaproteobacteria bacterium]|nr:single-stranded-DNA-specific exonuclease RecJ [Deltaproteobacteria bacterium]
MSAQKTTWHFLDSKESLVQEFSKELKLSPLTCRLLIQRGIQSLDEARDYLNPSLRSLPSPFLLQDMEKAVQRIERALLTQEMICVYGDYDVDGTTGASLLFQFFKNIGATVYYYIPHRIREGYGLNPGILEKLKAQDTKLVITCDCGTANHEEIRLIQSEGMDVIITDHHQIQSGHPPAYAFLNHQRLDCKYPQKTLSGVGVAFHLVMATRLHLRETGYFKDRQEPDIKDYLDLVALGTITDMVPIQGVNRILIANGLKVLNHCKRVGLRALMEKAGILNTEITSQSVGFGIGPRINAGGRIDHAQIIVELLTTEDESRACELAEFLEKKNKERRNIQERIFREACQFIALSFTVRDEVSMSLRGEQSSPWQSNLDSVLGFITDKCIVVGSHLWHPGVIGIVASKLVEKYYRPAVVVAFLEDGMGKGSCRSIAGFDLTQALLSCREHLEQCGGHAAAAGLSVRKEKFLDFAHCFHTAVEQRTNKQSFIPRLTLDAEADLECMTEEFVREIKYLEPFGVSNPEPVFASRNLKISTSKIVGEKHLKLFVKSKTKVREAIAFNKADVAQTLSESVDLAYVPELHEWRGITSVQLRVKDLQT